MAISAVDGRYHQKLQPLTLLGSEFALVRNRVKVECCWLIALAQCPDIAELPELNGQQIAALQQVYERFSEADAQWIKHTEERTNHDVKAVEYFVKEQVQQIQGLQAHQEFVHFACTSEDINSTSYALMLADLRAQLLAPGYQDVLSDLRAQADALADVAMLSRTHGQPASPTTLGKELRNVCERLQRQLDCFLAVPVLGKMNGAVGNYNAHYAAYPEVDWPALSRRLLADLGIEQNPYTTQIEPHDCIAEYGHALIRLNQILIDLSRDLWGYIAIDYFGQRTVAGETGSSTMPHKVNPIDFENAEGNLGLANALLAHLAEKLPISRWQRDLSDSTVLRNIGSAAGHCLIALNSTRKGLGKLQVNRERIAADLDGNWEVLGEAVQTVMRRYGMDEPYERLKAATRGQKRLTQQSYLELLTALELPPAAQEQLAALTPATYLGVAVTLARSN